MRELKFREFVNGKFHYWGFLKEGSFYGPVTPSTIRGKHDQYTGLKDRHGKEIYEGDRYKWKREVGVVVYDDGGFKCKSTTNCFYLDSMIFDIEITGNIHENPELIQEP